MIALGDPAKVVGPVQFSTPGSPCVCESSRNLNQYLRGSNALEAAKLNSGHEALDSGSRGSNAGVGRRLPSAGCCQGTFDTIVSRTWDAFASGGAVGSPVAREPAPAPPDFIDIATTDVHTAAKVMDDPVRFAGEIASLLGISAERVSIEIPPSEGATPTSPSPSLADDIVPSSSLPGHTRLAPTSAVPAPASSVEMLTTDTCLVLHLRTHPDFYLKVFAQLLNVDIRDLVLHPPDVKGATESEVVPTTSSKRNTSFIQRTHVQPACETDSAELSAAASLAYSRHQHATAVVQFRGLATKFAGAWPAPISAPTPFYALFPRPAGVVMQPHMPVPLVHFAPPPTAAGAPADKQARPAGVFMQPPMPVPLVHPAPPPTAAGAPADKQARPAGVVMQPPMPVPLVHSAPSPTAAGAPAAKQALFVRYDLQNMDYQGLEADEVMVKEFECVNKEVLAAAANVDPSQIRMALSAGSIVVKAEITASSVSNDDAKVLLASSPSFGSSVVSAVQSINGIAAVTTGPILMSGFTVSTVALDDAGVFSSPSPATAPVKPPSVSVSSPVEVNRPWIAEWGIDFKGPNGERAAETLVELINRPHGPLRNIFPATLASQQGMEFPLPKNAALRLGTVPGGSRGNDLLKAAEGVRSEAEEQIRIGQGVHRALVAAEIRLSQALNTRLKKLIGRGHLEGPEVESPDKYTRSPYGPWSPGEPPINDNWLDDR